MGRREYAGRRTARRWAVAAVDTSGSLPPEEATRVVRRLGWISFAMLIVGAACAPLIPEATGNTVAKYFLVMGALWAPWTIALLFLTRRPRGMASNMTMVSGGFVIVFAYQVMVPQMSAGAFCGAFLLVAIVSYLWRLWVSLGAAVIVIGLALLAIELSPSRYQVNAFTFMFFSGLLLSLAVLLDWASKEQSRAIDELRRLDAARGEFISNAAHELRTPLTTIAGYAVLLAESRRDLRAEDVDEGLQAMRRQGERARVLIDNLLDLSRIEQGNIALRPMEVQLVAEAHRALETAPPTTGVQVDVSIPDQLTARVDPLVLGRVLTNLLTNAYRYGGQHVRIEGGASNGSVRLAVSDDGEGVPQDLIPNLFTPFSRAEAVRGIVGSGLGLAISLSLIEASGGRVWYEPDTPHGARFVILLERAAA